MASTSAVGNLKEELNCSICWNIYTEPVSLTCGHNFCRKCIEKNWDKRDTVQVYSCPECRAEYNQKPVLQKNLKLCNIIERFEATQMNEEPIKILCDFCLDDPFPAVKTCMNCEASLCEHHFRKHSEKAAQKNHVLIEPASSLEDRKCSDHEKLIEYYCLDDHSCICVTCYVAGPHKNHDIRILKDIHNETKASLSEKLDKLQSSRASLEEATKELQGTEMNLKKDSATLRKQISDLFQEIRMLLTKQEKQILDTVISEKNLNLSKVLKKIQELEIKREVITHLIQEVQDLRNQKDPLFFIKDFKSTYERISNNNTEVEKLKVSWKRLDETTISNIKQETKRIFETLNTLIFDHPVQSNNEGVEDKFGMEDETEEENISDTMRSIGNGDIIRNPYSSVFCKDVPESWVVQRTDSRTKTICPGDQTASWILSSQEQPTQLTTSQQAVVVELMEGAVARPSAKQHKLHQMQLMSAMVPQELLDLNFQTLFLRLQEGKSADSADLQAAMGDMQTAVHGPNATNMRGTMQSDLTDMQAAMQSGMFADMQDALQNGMADHLNALQNGLIEIQDALHIGMSNIWDAIHTGLNQIDTNLQGVHCSVHKGLSQISKDIGLMVSFASDDLGIQDVFDSAELLTKLSLMTPEIKKNLREREQEEKPVAVGVGHSHLTCPSSSLEDVNAANVSTSCATMCQWQECGPQARLPRSSTWPICGKAITFPAKSKDEVMLQRFPMEDEDDEDNLTDNLRCEDSTSSISTLDTPVYYAEFEEEGGEMPYVIEDAMDEEYLDVLYIRNRGDNFTTQSM
eukprot:gi/632975848/ref/XP_007904455.1/ PREDICTED: uncharacterized protein LOC103186970 [Callorhinchus milii]